MKIIIVQNEELLLVMLKNAVNYFNRNRAAEVVFTSSPEKVLDEVRSQKELLIISGYKLKSGLTGIELAKKVKSIKPDAIFYIFSSTYRKSDDVDGHIFKYGGNEMALSKIIANSPDINTVKELLLEIEEF